MYKETPAGKPLLHQDGYNLGSKCVSNHGATVGMLNYEYMSSEPVIGRTYRSRFLYV